MNEKIVINIWLNEEREKTIAKEGLTELAEDRLAGMKVIRLQATENQKDRLVSLFPRAKYDSSTTGTIELLPRDVKDKLFDTCLQLKTADETVVEAFLKANEAKGK